MPGYYRDPHAPTPNKPRTIGAAALIVRDCSLLLDSRMDDAAWGLPAGRVEADETVTEAVIREVREETGLTVTSVVLFGIFSDPTRIVEYIDGNVYSLSPSRFVRSSRTTIRSRVRNLASSGSCCSARSAR
jgi:8-oxo-dGTP pyrophosphatase MutT (NUDIX family)